MADKVLITDYVHDVLASELTSIGLEIDYRPDISIEELHETIGNYEGLVFNSRVLAKEPLLSKGTKLKFIGRLGSGMEIVDQDYAAEKGIAVFNAPNGNCNAVAEHAMGMLLAFANNLLPSDSEVKEFQWNREQNRGFELEGKKVGVYAFGWTGRYFAQKLQGFDVDVLAYDKYKEGLTNEVPFVREVSESELVSESDIISLHLPLNPETKHLVDKAFLDRCKDGVVLINTSRGNVIKTEDLIEALESGKVAGACLDVLENEKPHLYNVEEKVLFGKLFSFDNVLLSPHVAGWTHESLYKIAFIIASKVKKLYGQ